jgi:hypothetical protein
MRIEGLKEKGLRRGHTIGEGAPSLRQATCERAHYSTSVCIS